MGVSAPPAPIVYRDTLLGPLFKSTIGILARRIHGDGLRGHARADTGRRHGRERAVGTNRELRDGSAQACSQHEA